MWNRIFFVFIFAVTINYAQRLFELKGNSLVVPGKIVYQAGSDKLAPESAAALDHVKSYLIEKAYISVMRIEVHTDADGDANRNQKLSEIRARNVARALVERGIDCKRLLPVGFGSGKPIAPNTTPENKAKNRRTEFMNAALRGRPIGGMPLDGGGVIAADPCR